MAARRASSRIRSLALMVSFGFLASCASIHRNQRVLALALPVASEAALAGFKLAERIEKRGMVQITFTNKTQTAKFDLIPHIDEASATQLRDEGIISLQALYANALSPYPGDISNEVVTSPAGRD